MDTDEPIMSVVAEEFKLRRQKSF